MIYDILEEKLRDIGLEDGVSLFRQFMPAGVTTGVMTRVPLEGIPEDPNMPGFYKGRIQVIIRHTDPVQGRIMANHVVSSLKFMTDEYHSASVERGAVKMSHFYPESLPIEFPSLKGDSLEWSVHFKTCFAICDN